MQRVGGTGGIAAGLGRRRPVLAVEDGEARRRADPDTVAGITLDGRDGARGQALGAAPVAQLAAVPPADAAEAIADPQPAARRRQQHRDAARRSLLARRRLEALELHAVEAEQPRRAAHPQQPVVGLRERLDLRGRAIAHRPGRVMQLRQRERAVQRERLSAAERQGEAGERSSKKRDSGDRHRDGGSCSAMSTMSRATDRPRVNCARADAEKALSDSATTRKGNRNFTRNPSIATPARSSESSLVDTLGIAASLGSGASVRQGARA